MASDMYLKLDGIAGDSSDGKHSGWIEFDAFSFSSTHMVEGKLSASSTLASGRTEVGDFTFTKAVDGSSANILKYLFTGKTVKEVNIEFCAATGEKHPYLVYKLTNAYFKSHSISAGADGRPTESFTLGFTKIQKDYTVWKTDGSKGGTTTARWDLTTNAEG